MTAITRDADYNIATYGLLLVISQCDKEEKYRDVVEVEGVEQRVSPSRNLLPLMLPDLHHDPLTTFILAHVLGRYRAVFRRCRRPVRAVGLELEDGQGERQEGQARLQAERGGGGADEAPSTHRTLIDTWSQKQDSAFLYSNSQ